MYTTDNLHCELGLHGLATFYPIILHALEMSINFPNSAISYHYCNLRISHSNTKLLVLALTPSVINHLFNVFCILFPCWDHGSEIPSGKVTWVPPTSLALSPAPLLSPDDCGLLFSEAKNQPHNLLIVFSPPYFFRWRLCEFSSTIQAFALQLEDHQDFPPVLYQSIN